MPSEDTLKQLLEDFVEKEALVTEEIKVVYEQIEQLKGKLEDCHRRLSTIGGDRDKVLRMRARYLEGNFDVGAASDGVAHEMLQATGLAQAPSPPAPEPAKPAQQPAATRPGRAARTPEPAAPTTEWSAPPPQQAAPAAPSQPPFAEEAPTEDPGAPPKPTLKGAARNKARPGLSAILGPLRNAASQLGGGLEPAPEEQTQAPQYLTDPSLPVRQLPSITETGSYILPTVPVSTAMGASLPTEELPRPEQDKPAQAAPQAPATNQPTAAQQQPEAPQQADKVVDLEKAEGKEEPDNDAMKSINDALRSLFR
jgi:hypothetical protein